MARKPPEQEQDTVRLKDEDETSPEQKAFDIRKYIRGINTDDRDERDDDDPKARKKRAKIEELEDRQHQAELDKQATELAPIFMVVGQQTTDRFTPKMPYTYDEALAFSKALVNFTDKYSDGLIADWKEEIALVLVGATQIVPRVMMWRAERPRDLSELPNTTVPKEPVQNGHP